MLGAILAPVVAALVSAAGALSAPDPAALASLTPAQLAGQRVVYGFAGTTPPADLVARIRRGEAGAVILLGSNAPSLAAARRLIARLQAVPRPAAVDLPLLVMLDQEGGGVRRLAGPPARSAAELGRAGPPTSRAAGRAAGRLLHGVGATVDLAPVADVARPGSFLAAGGRTFGSSAPRVSAAATAFAGGLAEAGVAATAKHFPGLGAARVSTDEAPVTIRLPARTLRAVDLAPYRALIPAGVPLVMLSTAIYPALAPGAPAALSRRIVTGELRGGLGFGGVSVTDALDTPALAAAGSPAGVAVRAARAGADLQLYTGYGAGVAAAGAGRTALRAGRLPPSEARASVARVLALRDRLARGALR
jgi:beta-N-acetylhexosaminidase